MKKSLVRGSLSAAALAGLFLVSGNNTKVQAAKDSQNGAPQQKSTSPVEAAQADVATAQTAVNTAKKTAEDKAKALAQAKTNNAGPIKAYDEQNQQVKAAQKSVEQKQSDLDAAKKAAQGATPEKIAQTQQDLTQAQNKKAADQTTLTAKETARDEKQTAYNNAKSEADTAASSVTSKQTALTNVKNAATAKASALATAKTNLQNAQDAEHVNPNKITIDGAYKTAVLNAQSYAESGRTLPDSVKNAIKAAGATLLRQNHYQSVAADQAETVDFNNITADQLKQIRVYYLKLINHLREQLGEQPLKFNNSAMRMSDEIAQKYESNNWDGSTRSHDVPAIRDGYSNFGMPGNMEEAMGFFSKGWLPNYEATYQNSSSQYELKTAGHTQVTLDDIENNLYGVVNNMLFNDEASNWGHTMGLTHPHSEFMGFAISRYGDTLTFHMNPVTPAAISEPTRFNVNDNVALDNSAAITALQAAVDAAQTAADAATAAQTAAQTAYDNAVSAKTAKETALTAAKTALDDAKQAVKSAEDAVTADQSQIDSLNTTLTAMRNPAAGISRAEAAVTAAQTALATEQNRLTALKPAKDAAQAQIDAAQRAVNEAQAAVTAAQNRLNAAQQRLEQLQNPTVSFTDNGVVVNTSNPAANKTANTAIKMPVDLMATLHEGQIALYDQNGKFMTYMAGGERVHLVEQLTRNNETFYRLNDSVQWVKASDLDLEPAKAKKTNQQAKKATKKSTKQAKKAYLGRRYRRVARVVKKVTLVDGKGKKTKRTLKVGTNWKVFAKKKIKGQLYYRLGNQKQWALAKNMRILKHSKF